MTTRSGTQYDKYFGIVYLCNPNEGSGSGVELRTLDYKNPGSDPVLRC